MQKYFSLALICLTICSTSCKGTKKKVVTVDSRDSISKIAQADLANNQLKYFYHSIAAPTAELTNFLKEKCSVTVISAGDVANKNDSFYNAFADSVIKVKTGMTVAEISKQFK
ncbi:hypothetical protein ABIC45_004233 [Mucilaginibacter rubeus]|uniref:hypothetical protein n=1 Tax=Mucilaginibacter rubeus TaxID=2027860 RepID=UPI003396ABDD